MLITKMINGGGVENGSGYSCLSMEKRFGGEGKGEIMGMIKGVKENEGDFWGNNSSCSSIGKNSDDDNDEEEVQSNYKSDIGSFDSIQALEEALPMRRGMSNFYNGKSKSFASLADARSSTSINEIAKPENAYSRRRRNVLAFNLSDKNRSQLKANGGVSKKSSNSSKSTLALGVAMNRPKSHEKESNSESSPNLVSRLSPHHPQVRQSQCNSSSFAPRGNISACRSFSFADLEHCGSFNAQAPR